MAYLNSTATGRSGEDLAVDYLGHHGYQILERNYRIRGGEIDIIARDGDFLVFVEVKTRYTHDFGLPIESITPWKIKFILKSALFYINKIRWKDRQYRLDVVTVDYLLGQPLIELHRNVTQ